MMRFVVLTLESFKARHWFLTAKRCAVLLSGPVSWKRAQCSMCLASKTNKSEDWRENQIQTSQTNKKRKRRAKRDKEKHAPDPRPAEWWTVSNNCAGDGWCDHDGWWWWEDDGNWNGNKYTHDRTVCTGTINFAPVPVFIHLHTLRSGLLPNDIILYHNFCTSLLNSRRDDGTNKIGSGTNGISTWQNNKMYNGRWKNCGGQLGMYWSTVSLRKSFWILLQNDHRNIFVKHYQLTNKFINPTKKKYNIERR